MKYSMIALILGVLCNFGISQDSSKKDPTNDNDHLIKAKAVFSVD